MRINSNEKMIDHFIGIHKNFWTKPRLWALSWGVIFLAATLIIQQLANNYVSAINGPVVSDLIVNHLPIWDISRIFVQATIASTILVTILLLAKPKYLVFTIKSLAVFVLIRSFFIILTHLGTNPYQLQPNPENLGYTVYNFLYNAKGDFFFSGHTGVQFLLALIFWREKAWRYFFLACSVLFGAAVLIGRLHYSIDVFAAPFIAHSIFTVSMRLFPKEFAHTKES